MALYLKLVLFIDSIKSKWRILGDTLTQWQQLMLASTKGLRPKAIFTFIVFFSFTKCLLPSRCDFAQHCICQTWINFEWKFCIYVHCMIHSRGNSGCKKSITLTLKNSHSALNVVKNTVNFHFWLEKTWTWKYFLNRNMDIPRLRNCNRCNMIQSHLQN